MTIENQLEKLIYGRENRANVLLLCYASTAGSINKMKELECSLKFSLERNIVTEKECYEALLQIYLFAGFPAAIESLSVLNSVANDKTYKNSQVHYTIDLFRYRGEELCKRVYTTAYYKMRKKLHGISPELDEWMIIEGYGKTLSRSGLSSKTRELITASSLAALGWENQLFSHIRGAISVGSNHEECFELLEVLTLLCSIDVINRTKIIIENVVHSKL